MDATQILHMAFDDLFLVRVTESMEYTRPFPPWLIWIVTVWTAYAKF